MNSEVNCKTFHFFIIALDPAAPLIGDDIRLTRKDAIRVHTLQTNAGVLGDLGSIGHVDVCVNKGITQPFCADATSKILKNHGFFFIIDLIEFIL